MQKQIILILIIIFSFSFPARALQPITDKEMNDITGGAGISMVIDDFSIYLPIEKIYFSDRDGQNFNWYDEKYVGPAQGAQLRLEGFELNSLHLETITSDGQMGKNASHFVPAQSSDITDFQFKPMTFDIASNAPSLFWGPTSDSRTGFVIGLPTLNIYVDALNINAIRTKVLHDDRSGYNDNMSITKLNISGINIATLDGKIAFMNHGSSGVDIAMDDIQIYMKVDEIRFTDTDGLWNTIEDVYQCIPQLLNPYDKDIPDGGNGGVAFSIAVRDVEIDTLRINSLYFSSIPASGDTTTTPGISSPGSTSAHIKTSAQETDPFKRLDNFKRQDMPTLSGDLKGRPLQIDIGSNLPTATTLGISTNTVGIRISLPTQELYAKKIVIGGIYMSDPVTKDPTYTASNSFDNYPAVSSPDTKADIYRPVYNNETSFMQVRMEDSLTAILSGNMEILAH
jgi:hypothetical protein